MTQTSSKLLQFPTIAKPNIDDVFKEFLRSQKGRLKPKTYRRYVEVVDLYRHCLNSYGFNELTSSSESAMYERFYEYKNLDFCTIFGADKILPSLSYFLNFFMIRKVISSEALLHGAGTVSKKLVKWLEEKGTIDQEQAHKASVIAAEATRELPAVERLARLLYEFSQTHSPRYWTAELDDYFIIEKVEPGLVHLSAMSSPDQVEVRLPKEITDHCRLGWQVNLLLGKTRNGWSIMETGNVYPG
jgi:hypothetical protein